MTALTVVFMFVAFIIVMIVSFALGYEYGRQERQVKEPKAVEPWDGWYDGYGYVDAWKTMFPFDRHGKRWDKS